MTKSGRSTRYLTSVKARASTIVFEKGVEVALSLSLDLETVAGVGSTLIIFRSSYGSYAVGHLRASSDLDFSVVMPAVAMSLVMTELADAPCDGPSYIDQV